MKYRIKKETKPRLSTFGQYKAVAVHQCEVSSKMIIKEAAAVENSHFSEADITSVILRLSEVISTHLRNGDRVRLEEWGLMKLEIESDKVATPKAFRPKKHIRGVRLHFIPESHKHVQPLYDGITFEKDKNYVEE